MPEFGTVYVVAAKLRANHLTAELSRLLERFNETYPDPDAARVKEHFDFVNRQHIARACGSVLAEHFIVEHDVKAPVEFDIDVDEELAGLRATLVGKAAELRMFDPRQLRFVDREIDILKE